MLGIDIKLTAKELALYHYIALETDKKVLVDRHFIESTAPSKAYLSVYSKMKGDVRVYRTFGLEDDIAWREQALTTLKPMEKEFIQPIRTQVNSKLKKALPAEIYEKVQIHSQRVSGGNQYWIAPALLVKEV